MEMKFDWKGIAAVLLIAALSVGALWFPAKETLPDFSVAIKVRQAIEGQSAPMHIQIASLFAGALGMTGTQGIIALLLYLPPFILAACAVLLYLSLRNLEYRRSVAAACSLLFSLSLAALYFAPGVYSPESIGALLLCASIFCISLLAGRQTRLMAVPAAIFAALAGYASPQFAVAGAAVAVCFLAGDYLKEKKLLAHYGLIAISAAAGAFASPSEGGLFFSALSFSDSFALFPLLIGAALCSLVLFFLGGKDARSASLAAAGLAVGGFSPIAGALVLVLPAAAGINGAMDEKLGKAAKLSLAMMLAFFAVFSIAYPISDAYKAIIAGLFVGAIFPVVMHSYGYRSGPMVLAMGIGMLSISFFSLAAYPIGSQGAFSPQYMDKDASNALLSVSSLNPSGIAADSQYASAARFYSPSSALVPQKDFASYLSVGKPVPASGTVVAVSLYDIDVGTAGSGYQSFYFLANSSNGANRYAMFASADGRVLARELSSDGGFALRDADYIDAQGRFYATAPLSRMLILDGTVGFSDPYNRLIVLDEGAPVPYFMKIYGGKADEIRLVSKAGKMSVFRVK